MNGRKVRQLRSQGGQKRFRRNAKKNRVTAEEFNAAREAVLAEQAEAQQYYEETVAALAEEPQFAILNPFNGESLLVAAQSMIFPLGVNGRGESLEPQPEAAEGTEAGVAPGEAQDANPVAPESVGDSLNLGGEPYRNIDPDTFPSLTPEPSKVILPGTAAALGIETP